MSAETPRVRFAPSPSGSLHIGNARTALFNWLFARRYDGVFILRIEDTDQERVSDVHTKNLLEELIWLGLDWDEGPLKGGKSGPYYQSQRLPFYQEYLEALKKDGRVYLCYCTEEELECERRLQRSRKLTPRYTGKCRALSPKERLQLEREGRRPAYRFAVGEGVLEFTDLIRGPMKFDCRSLGDFIILRSSGMPAYNFAVVVDDHLMGITHVIRGEDHLSNTAAQLLIYQALDLTPPKFAHHALVLGADQAKLSKRHGAVSLKEFRDQGYLPEALVNYLSIIGTTIVGANEIQTREESVKNFSLDKLGRAGAIFDEAKLRWVNEHYLRREEPESLLIHFEPFWVRAGYDPALFERDKLLKLLQVVRENISTLADILPWWEIFRGPVPQMDPQAEKIIKEEGAKQVLQKFAQALEDTETEGEGLFRELSERLKKTNGISPGKLFLPLRAALTGRTRGPELEGIFRLLGRKAIRQRVRAVLDD